MKIIKDEHRFTYNNAMVCASYEASLKTYRKVGGKSGNTWLVPTLGDPSKIHLDRHDPKSKGYGGSTLTFRLDNGEEYSVKGPWNSNSDSLYHDTGIDLRNNHKSRGIVALKREVPEDRSRYSSMDYIYKDVLHLDEDMVRGSFNRVEDIGQKIANELNQTVYYQVVSQDGGSSGTIEPQREKKDDSK